MKTNIAVGLLSVALATTVQAISYSPVPGTLPLQIIPEVDAGVQSTIHVPDSGTVLDVNVWLDIGAAAIQGNSAAWNGDFYVKLTHGSDISVLLNRVGRGDASRLSGVSELGYAQNGFNITLDDGALSDVHWYGREGSGAQYNQAGQLTGAWQPDGRVLDPDAAVTSYEGAAREGMLSVFNGADASGDWSLYLYDANGGSLGQLNGWRLDIEMSTGVPDSSLGGIWFSIVLFGGLLAAARKRSWIAGN